MKSGTSSLYNYLNMHPEIFMSPKKEPMHFSNEESWSKGHAQYLSLFSEATSEKYLGEASTNYSKLPRRHGVAERIYDFNPDSKIIYLMRDPFERIVSQYKHMVRKEGETRPLRSILFDDDYITNSHYAMQLKPYLKFFDGVYAQTFEEMIDDPAEFCARIFKWLGVREYKLDLNKEAYHVTPKRYEAVKKNTLKGKLYWFLKKGKYDKLIPGDLRRKFVKLFPKEVVVDFSSDSFRNDILQSKKIAQNTLMQQTLELESLLGITFEKWKI